MGCSTLYHLAKFGVSDAILLERNKLTSGTTWHSAAQVRALRSSRNLTDLIRYSVSLYSSLEQETGQPTGWINKGSLSIATNQSRLTHILRQQALAHSFGVVTDSISAGEASEHWPLMNADDVIGAVWSPDDGRVSPSDLCAALTKGARAYGGRIFEDSGVEGIVTEGGRVVAVETVGGTVRCDAIALCSGLWSKENGNMAGVNVPLWPCEHFYLLTKPIEGISGNMPTLSDHDSHLYIRDDSGGLLIGCFEPMGKSIDPAALGKNFAFQLLEEDWDHFEPMMINALHRLPILEQAEVKTLLNGPESFTPDGSFLLGESAETRGFFLGCGMNSVGVASGGGAGMALARNIIDGHLPMDLHEVDPKRFPNCFNSAAALAQRVPEVLGKHYEITFPGRQWQTARRLRQSPLEPRWRLANAVFGQVYGWERPLYFARSKVIGDQPELTFERPAWFDLVGHEVNRAHTAAAVFDQSTFGKIRVTGADAESWLNRLCANNMARAPGKVIYTAMLNDRGGIESDLTAFRIGEEDYLLYIGTAAVKRDMAWLRNHLEPGLRVTLVDETPQWGVIALMGPDTPVLARSLGAGALNELKYFSHQSLEIGGIGVTAARMSFVGEAGFELTCRAEDTIRLFDLIAQEGVTPAGLYAQTSMRIEKRYLSFGHDLDTDINPLQADLDFAVDWNSEFIGKSALKNIREKPLDSRLISIILDSQDANSIGNEPIYCNGEIVGQTTSAAYGYRVDRPVALGYIQSRILNSSDISIQDDLKVNIDIARQMFAGTVLTGPVFDPTGARMRTNLPTGNSL